MSVVVAPSLPLPDAPYRGIKPFRFIDQQLFAARDKEIWELVSNITLYRAVLLYGDSGTGKSSLINAGLVPQIKGEKVLDRLRVQPFAGREIKIERIAANDGEQPTYLPSNFTAPDVEAYDPQASVDAESFELSLKSFRQQLERFRPVEQEPAEVESFFDAPRSSPGPLLVFDQFEEFITLFEEAQRGGPTAEAKIAQQQAPIVQRAIVDLLVELIQDKALPVNIIFTFREDYLAKLSSLFDARPELLDQSQRLLPPAVESLAKIIRAPFDNPTLRSHFLHADGEKEPAGSELSKGLAHRIAAALGRRSRVDGVNLTELQIVCERLWQSKDPEALFRRKGIVNILRDHAADVFGRLPLGLRDEAEALLSHMITVSNTRNIISENDLLSRASERTKLPHDQLHETLDALCDIQLVRRERRRDLFFYELSSEYFVPWIKDRVAERDALEAQIKTLETRQRVAMQRLRVRRDRRRTRLLKRLLFGLVILLATLIVVGGFAAYFYNKSLKASQQVAAADQGRLRAEGETQLARQQKERYEAAFKVLASKDDTEKLALLSKILKWNEEGTFPPELVVLLVAGQSTSENPEIKQKTSQLLAQVALKDASLSQSIVSLAETNASLAEKLPARFYIHIADDSQKPEAQRIANALREEGYLVPGIQQIVSGDAPKWDYELRYFRKGEEGMPTASEILSLLKQSTGSNWIDAYNPRYENSPKIRPGHFELWFPAPTGQLQVSLVDEEGKPLHGAKMIIIFEPVGGEGLRFIRRRPGRIAVPPGQYDVSIRVEGFKEQHLPLMMEVDGRVDWSQLKLIRDNSAPR